MTTSTVLKIADLSERQQIFARDVRADYAVPAGDAAVVRLYRETPDRTVRWIVTADGELVDQATF